MKKAILWLISGILLLVVGFGGVLGWGLLTQGGRDFFVSKLNGYMATLEAPVVVGRVSGRLWREVDLASLSVADRQGIWLTVEGVRLVWHPLALWRGEAPFERLEVAKIGVARLPEGGKTPEEPVQEGDVNPLDYIMYIPREIHIGEVLVEAGVAGRRHRLAAEMTSVGGVQGISVSTLEGPVTAISGTVVLEAKDAGRVALVVKEVPQGLLGGLLKMPAKTDIYGVVKARMAAGLVTLDEADIRVGQSRIRGGGEAAADGGKISGTAVITAENLAEWQGLAAADLRGVFGGKVAVSGGMEKLGVQVDISRADVAVGDLRVAKGVGQVSGTVGLPLGYDVGFSVKGDVQGVGQGTYPLRIAGRVSGTEAVVDGNVLVGMARKGEKAELRVGGAGVVSPLMGEGTLAGWWEKGRDRFTVQAGGKVDAQRAVLNGIRMTGPGVNVSGSGVVDMARYLVDGAAVVKVADLRPLGALAGVDLRGGLDADVNASAKSGMQTARARVGRFEVAYGDYSAKLRQPTSLVWDGKGGEITRMVLDVAGGTVVLDGRLTETSVRGVLEISGLDVEQLADSDVVTGKAGLRATLSGRPEAPVVVVDGEFRGETGTYPLAVTVKGDWRGGRLQVKTDATSREAKATADVTVAGKLSLLPFAMDVNEESAVRGAVTAHVPLAMFNPYLWASRQQVEGVVSGQGTLGGKLGAPQVNGRFTLADGAYSHSTLGLCLKNISAELVGSQDQLVLEKLAASDGRGGSLNGQGRLGLRAPMPLQAGLAVKDLQMFCGGLATGRVDGNVAAQGTLADHLISGKLVVGPLHVQVPGASRDTDIPHVETVRVRAGAEDSSAPTMRTRLAVEVDAPQQIYVRGRGLDAEFGGNIKINGTADAPLLTGSLKALRGTFTLLDRTLQLADSAVRFEGPIPPSPYLDVKAVTQAQGTTINLNVTGAATKPALTLTSDPSVPQDEALALLLFGRKLENISAFEALKLAQATRVLAGLDSGEPTILDKARDTLGVDTLDIGSGEDSGDVTITTGKYLTDKVYVSMEQGTEPQDRQFKTEIELTPSISGNTTVDGVGNQSFGIEWKRDY